MSCTTTIEATIYAPYPSSVSVDPVDFLGLVPCPAAPGGMRSSVATLTDVTDQAPPFTLASSPPVRCTTFASFRFLALNHTYKADVDGYTYGVDEIEPFSTLNVPPPSDAGADA